MAIKLYIFESVEDARRFSANDECDGPGIEEAPGGHTHDPDAEREREEPKPRRKKRKAAKEVFKERILEKARATQATAKVGRKCGKCGAIGHRADHCPNGGLKVKDVERFDSHEEDEE